MRSLFPITSPALPEGMRLQGEGFYALDLHIVPEGTADGVVVVSGCLGFMPAEEGGLGLDYVMTADGKFYLHQKTWGITYGKWVDIVFKDNNLWMRESEDQF